MSFDNPSLDTTVAATEAAPAAPKVVLTKEQKIAKVDEQIAKLQARREDIINDVVRAPAAKKEVALPEVGATVTFFHGRKTANTEPVEKLGTVVAIKPAGEVDGKRTPAQIKVAFGEGFDLETAVIYPAQIVATVADEEIAE
jgi:hypothetical protein